MKDRKIIGYKYNSIIYKNPEEVAAAVLDYAFPKFMTFTNEEKIKIIDRETSFVEAVYEGDELKDVATKIVEEYIKNERKKEDAKYW